MLLCAIFVANLSRTLCTAFYQNQLRFVEDMTKHFGSYNIVVNTVFSACTYNGSEVD